MLLSRRLSCYTVQHACHYPSLFHSELKLTHSQIFFVHLLHHGLFLPVGLISRTVYQLIIFCFCSCFCFCVILVSGHMQWTTLASSLANVDTLWLFKFDFILLLSIATVADSKGGGGGGRPPIGSEFFQKAYFFRVKGL